LAYIYWLVRGTHRRSRRQLLLAAVFLVASCLTHVSALAVNLAFTVPWACLRFARHRNWRVLVLAGSLAVPAAAVFWLDPARGARFVGTLLRPWSAFSPDWGAASQQPAVWVGNALGILGLVVLRKTRLELEPWARDLLAASSLAALALSCPLLRPDLLERLALVSLVPGLVAAVFLAGWLPAGPVLLAPLLVLALTNGFLAVKTLRVTGLVRPAFDELQALHDVLPTGPRIVMVRPLLRWWVGSKPVSALRDGALLERESFGVLREGTYFRLSRLLSGAGSTVSDAAGR
jgi:hypothetical protein